MMIYIQDNAFENAVCKMLVILSNSSQVDIYNIHYDILNNRVIAIVT